MPDVFISYARTSERQARAAAAALRQAGYSVWFDEDLPSHRAYGDVIEEQLASARAVVVLWSAEAARSQWVRAEANRAREEDKLVQLTLDKISLPLPFDQIQCADLSGWTGDGDHPGWSRVVAGVALLVTGKAGRPTAPVRAPAAETLLAVLPFDPQPPDAETRALADGLAEEIIHGLVAGGDLKVIGRTASLRFRGEAKAQAAEALKATHIVDGAVRRAGKQARISVQLTLTASGAALWGERFDRDASDSFALQDEVAALVSAAVRAALPAAASPQVRPGHEASEAGERRHVTILACGLVDPARFASLDPERWRAIATSFQERARDAAERLGGFVARSPGDGLEIYFGYPEAREDAAECAVRAGLAIVQSMAGLNEELTTGDRLKVRVGIHAGTVVVAKGDGDGVDLFGDAPRTAAAIQGAAAPDETLISGVVHDLVSGLFVVEEVDQAPALEEAPRLFRAIRPGFPSGRARGFTAAETSPFVDREDERHLLASRGRRVRQGEGQSVLLLGEAGIGKTRLIEEFRDSIKADPHLWIECAGAPLFANTPFHAVSRMMEQGLGWQSDEDGAARVGRLEQALAPAGLKLSEAVPLIAEMLNLPPPEGYAPLMFAPDQRRARLLAALTAWVFSASVGQPLIIVIEDLQWVDPSTMELIQTLVEQGARAPLFLLLTARPDFRTPWPARGHHAQVTLSRLADRDTRALIQGLLERVKLKSALLESIIERADGVPLFAEELARLMTEAHTEVDVHAIPVSLRDSLTARLDRLGRAKETAQLAAVIGREFSYELMAAVSSLPERQLQEDLSTLTDGDVIFARGLPPYANYLFKHALMQDAAYDALLKSRRRDLHAKIAQTIATRFAAFGTAHPEVLARHWTAAGEAAPAVAAWKAAGESALERRAFKEAEGAFRSAVDILLGEKASPERDAEELALVSQLARVLAMTRGYAAPETVEAAGRAKALAEKSGSVAQLIREEGRIWQATVTTGDYAGAAALADHVMDLARSDGESPQRLIFAHNAQLQTRFYTGDLAGVEEHFALMSPLIEQAGARQAPGNNIISIGVASLSAWSLGHSDQAQERAARAAAMAERSQHPYDLAMTLHFQGLLHVCERDPERAGAAAERLLAVAEENGLSYARELARGTLGWARSRLGGAASGLQLMWLAKSEATGAQVGLTFGLTMAAEVRALAGEYESALEALEEALTVNPQERVFRPFTFVTRAELLLAHGEGAAAEADYREAIAVAEAMGAKAWEWRATAALARLLVDRGAAAAGRELVAPLLADAQAGEITTLAAELGWS